jgi:hypothetical protein
MLVRTKAAENMLVFIDVNYAYSLPAACQNVTYWVLIDCEGSFSLFLPGSGRVLLN